MANKVRRTAVRMDEEMWKWLGRVARSSDTTPSHVVRRVVSHVMYGGVSMPAGMTRPSATPATARKAGGA